MPPVLTCLIGKRLGDPNVLSFNTTTHFELRDLSASLIGLICRRFGETTHTLRPRLTRTCLKAFLDPSKPPGSHYGALIGLHAIGGKESVRVLIIPNLRLFEAVIRDGLQSEDELKKTESENCMKAILAVLKSLEQEKGLWIGGGGADVDMMDYTNGNEDSGDGIPAALKMRLAAKVGELVAGEVCKMENRGLVEAILDGGAARGR